MRGVEIRPVELKADYPVLKTWWEKRKFPPAVPYFMPPLGYLASFNDEPVCAGFLFKTDAHLASISHLVSNPEVKREVRSTLLDAVITALMETAVEDGFELVTCATNLERLGHRFLGHGFEKTDENVAHYWRIFPCP